MKIYTKTQDEGRVSFTPPISWDGHTTIVVFANLSFAGINCPTIKSFDDLSITTTKKLKWWAKYLAKGYKRKGSKKVMYPSNTKFEDHHITFAFQFR